MNPKVKCFEDLIAWKKGMDLAVDIYQLSRAFQRDFVLCDQMHGSAISIPSNIAEGFERGSRAEFHHFLSIAKSSCGELRTQLHLARRVGYLGDQTVHPVLLLAEEVSRIIGGLRSTVAIQRKTPRL